MLIVAATVFSSLRVVSYPCEGYSDEVQGGFADDVWGVVAGRLVKGDSKWNIAPMEWHSKEEILTRNISFDVAVGCLPVADGTLLRDFDVTTPYYETSVGVVLNRPRSPSGRLCGMLVVFLKFLSAFLVVLGFYTMTLVAEYHITIAAVVALRQIVLVEIQWSKMRVGLQIASFLASAGVFTCCIAAMTAELTVDHYRKIDHPVQLAFHNVGVLDDRSNRYAKDVKSTPHPGSWSALSTKLEEGDVEGVFGELPRLFLQKIDEKKFYIHPIGVRPYSLGFAVQKKSGLRDEISIKIAEWREEGASVGFEGSVVSLQRKHFGVKVDSGYTRSAAEDDAVPFIVTSCIVAVQILALVGYHYGVKKNRVAPNPPPTPRPREVLRCIAHLTSLLAQPDDAKVVAAAKLSLESLCVKSKPVTYKEEEDNPEAFMEF